jgi:hypothetical protein
MMGRRKARAILGAAVVSVLLGGVCFGRYSGGTGEPNDPYRIGTAADLTDIANHIEDYNKCFVMVNDINLAGHAWAESNIIGNYYNPFTGFFDGNGRVISNLTIDAPTVHRVGLFGRIHKDGEVKNLGVEDVNISGDTHVGGLCGSNNGTISQCYSAGSVNGYRYVGGMCGRNYGTISQCCSTGSVSGGGDVGGLCGSNHGIISQCYSTGSVNGGGDVGGLCGDNFDGAVSQCYSRASVSGDDGVGGLCGDSYSGTINYCYSTGSVTATGYLVGGLCGFGPSSGARNNFWDVETSGISATRGGGIGLGTAQMQSLNTYSLNGWSGEVWTIDDGNDYPHLAWENAGGVYIPEPTFLLPGSGTEGDPYRIDSVDDFVEVSVGRYYWDKHLVLEDDLDVWGVHLVRIGHDRNECFSGVFDGDGHVISHLKISSTLDYVGLFGYIGGGSEVRNLGLVDVDISGSWYVGGLCGYNRDGTISNCYSTGSVTGTARAMDIGGLCGRNSMGTISNCYSTCAVNGDEHVGGLCGNNYSGTISNCYSTGSVSGEDRVGGLCGSTGETVIMSFWDVVTSGTSWNGGGRGLSTAMMQSMRTYSLNGWSGQTWTIDDGNDYPHLAWENAGGEYIAEAEMAVSLDGSGTEAEPYLIGSLDDFMEFSIGTYYWDKHLRLESDLDVGDVNVLRIGCDSLHIFTGVFDGNSHIISNLTVDLPSNDYVGLFGYIGSGSEVKNLGVEDVNISGDSDVGGLCGSNYGTLSNCYSTGTVSGGDFVGGLVGYNSDANVIECYSSSSVFGQWTVGGLCGDNDEGWISNSYSTGMINGAGFYVGGLCGRNSGRLSDCYSTGTVSGEGYVGGLCGSHSAHSPEAIIINCYSTGSVTGAWEFVGGLCGYNSRGTLTDCYSTGSVTGEHDCVGGLCGRSYNGTIETCRSTGDVSGREAVGGLCGENAYGSINNSYSTGSVIGWGDTFWAGGFVGGICGYNGQGLITECYSTGMISGEGDFVGGLCGENFEGTLSKCYSTGAVSGDDHVGGLCGENYGRGGDPIISNCYSTGSVTGNGSCVGGLCGYNGTYSDEEPIISNCYSTGTVSGTDHVGGLCGYNYNGTVTGSFWDVNSSGISGSDGGIGADTWLMQRMCLYSYNGWGGQTWTIDDGNDYPHLAWENVAGAYIAEPIISLPGGGTEAEPYQITSLDDFVEFNLWTDYYRDKHLVLEGDLDVQGVYLLRIGHDPEYPFTGVFDGNGHVIRNLTMDMGNSNYVGLFCYIGDGGEVSNLGLEDVNINGRDHVGALCGMNYKGTVNNCYSTGNVSGASDVGGLCGYSGGLFIRALISNSYSASRVTGTGSNIGGLCGYNEGIIEECFSTGSVTGADSNVGGLCGYNSRHGIIMECCSTGSVSGDSYVGGLCGGSEWRIHTSYSAGNVIGTGDYVGGLCGFSGGVIWDCYSRSSVTGVANVGGLCGGARSIHTSYSTGTVTGSGDYVGGLCGQVYFEVSNSFWDVNTSGMSISDGGTGLPTMEMMDANTFLDAGWDFVDETVNGTKDIWYIDGVDYPQLWGLRCLPQVEVPMKLTPQTLNAPSEGRWIKAHFKLPEGVLPEEVDVNWPAVLEPLGIESEYIDVFVNKEGLVEVLAAFNRSDFCCSEPVGDLVTVERLSFAGQCFYGTDTVRVIDKRLELIGSLAMYWLEDCAGPEWCDGSDVNADGVVNLHDFALVERFCVEVISE